MVAAGLSRDEQEALRGLNLVYETQLCDNGRALVARCTDACSGQTVAVKLLPRAGLSASVRSEISNFRCAPCSAADLYPRCSICDTC